MDYGAAYLSASRFGPSTFLLVQAVWSWAPFPCSRKGRDRPAPAAPPRSHDSPAQFWRQRGRLWAPKPVAGRRRGGHSGRPAVPATPRGTDSRRYRGTRPLAVTTDGQVSRLRLSPSLPTPHLRPLKPRSLRAAVPLARGTEPGCLRPGVAPHALGAARGNPDVKHKATSAQATPASPSPAQAAPIPPPPRSGLPAHQRRSARPAARREALPVTSRLSRREARGTSGDVTCTPETQPCCPGTPRLASYRFANSLNIANRMPRVLQKTAAPFSRAHGTPSNRN